MNYYITVSKMLIAVTILTCFYNYFIKIDWVKALVLSADGRYIISGGGDKTLRIFDIQTKGQKRLYHDAHSGNILLVIDSF